MFDFLARIFRFLFWLVIVSWSVALLRRVLAWMLRGAVPAQADRDAASSVGGAGVGAPAPGDSQSGVAARRLVRDPVCGMHVAEVLAVPLRESGELVHFCSTACRDKYVNSTQRMAANG
jgi:YHS domain-containing protein